MDEQHIVILGAGLIGGFLGGVLAAGGARLTLLGRARVLEPLADGMTITDLTGLKLHVQPEQFARTSDAACLATADIVLVCVKTSANQSAAADLASFARAGTLVVSFQNGIGNAQALQALAPTVHVIAGMVPFNVMQPSSANWHRGTAGAMYAAPDPRLEKLVPIFSRANIRLNFHDDMRAVAWSKILINLNNAVNALSGLPLRAELDDRNYRLVLAACVEEALRVLNASGIEPAQINARKPGALPRILRWPNFLYRTLATRQLKIDSKARSSMAEDLALGRKTEIDDINGAVVALGKQQGIATPVNERIIALIHQAENGDARRFTGQELLRAL